MEEGGFAIKKPCFSNLAFFFDLKTRLKSRGRCQEIRNAHLSEKHFCAELSEPRRRHKEARNTELFGRRTTNAESSTIHEMESEHHLVNSLEDSWQQHR